MAASNVAIANRALQRLGATRISALDQNHPNARSMAAAFDPVRRALLRKYAWSFAITRASVAADSTDTLWGDLKRYALPSDFLRLLRDDEQRRDWKREGMFIVTRDSAPLQFRYVADITNPAQFDALFDEALAMSLAQAACEEVTGSTNKLESVIGDLLEVVAEGRRTNAIEREADTTLPEDWEVAGF